MLVTVTTQDVAEFQSTRTPTSARLYASKDFRASTGELIAKGSNANPDFYQDIGVSMVGDNLRIATSVIHSTRDALVGNTATYSLVVYDENGAKIKTLFSGLRVPAVTPTTWTALHIASQSRPQTHSPRFMDDDAVIALYNQRPPAENASLSVIGLTALDTEPADPNSPIAVGANSSVLSGFDTRLDALENAAPVVGGLPSLSGTYNNDFTEALAAIGSDETTLLITEPVITAGVVIPANIYLQKEANGTITGPVEFEGMGLRNPLDTKPLFLAASPGDVVWTGGEYPRAISTALWDSGNNNLTPRYKCADAALLGKKALIVCYPGNLTGLGPTTATSILITEGHDVLMMPGDYPNISAYAGSGFYRPPILMESNTSLRSMPGARIYESSVVGVLGSAIVSDASAWNTDPVNENITIEGNFFVGVDGQSPSQGVSTLLLGKCINGTIRNNTFHETRGYVVFGWSNQDYIISDTGLIEGNHFIRCMTQPLAIIAARNVLVRANRFDHRNNPGGTSSVGGMLDIEPNRKEDIVENITIEDNIFNMDGPGYPFAVIGQALFGGRGLTIRNNTFISGELLDIDGTNEGAGLMQCAIWAYGWEELEVTDNKIRGGYAMPIRLFGNRDMRVERNNLIAGTTGAVPDSNIEVVSCIDSDIRDNSVNQTTLPDYVAGQPAGIYEDEWPWTVTASGTTISVEVNPYNWPYGGFYPHYDGLTVKFNGIERTIASVTQYLAMELTANVGTVPVSSYLPVDVNTSTNTITITAHGLLTGAKVFMYNTPFSAANFPTHTRPASPLGSAAASVWTWTGGWYYIIKVDNNSVKLAATEADAINNVEIDFTGTSTGTNYIVPVMETLFSSNRYSGNKTPDGIILAATGSSQIISSYHDGVITNATDANYTIQRDDGIIIFPALTAARTATLPDPTTLKGKEYTIIGPPNASLFNLTIEPGTQTISGMVLQNDFQTAKVKSDGTEWVIIHREPIEAITEAAAEAGESAGRVLFNRFADATTTGVAEETLYTDTFAADTLQVNGYMIRGKYSGSYAATANTKHLKLVFAGTTIFDSSTFDTVVSNAKDWKLEYEIVKVSNTVVRCTVTLYNPDWNPWPKVTEITGLNLSSTAYDLVLKATTLTAAAGLTAKSGFAEYVTGVAPTAINVALTANGSTATVSSIGQGSADHGIDGIRNPSGGTTVWQSNQTPSEASPDWMAVDFGIQRTISRIDLIGVRDVGGSMGTVDPTIGEIGTLGCSVNFKIQTWDGSAWVDRAVISGNNQVWRQVEITPVRTNKVRVLITSVQYIRTFVVELEAWGY